MIFPKHKKNHMKRTPEDQVALAVRILDNRHFDDVRSRAEAELGERGTTLGPLDMSRNVLGSYVDRIDRAYVSPPLVTGGLDAELAAFVGDHSSAVTVERYATVQGRPLPTEQVQASARALRYRLGAGYAGVLLGLDRRRNRLALEVIPPDDLRLEFASESPSEPTVIHHRRERILDGKAVICDDCYDLTDPKKPSYTITSEGKDITDQVLGEYAGDWWWRTSDDEPFHRIVITGHPHEPYRTHTLVEATLSVCVAWTHWRAGVVDAGHPSRNAIGLRLAGADQDGDTGTQGVTTGPEVVHVWEHLDPERPGMLVQFGPGFDPEVIGRAVRAYEVSAMSAQGLPLALDSTGGAPTQEEREAIAEIVRQTYPECRRFDAELLARAAAIRNRLGREKVLPASSHPESGFGLLYGEEVQQALAPKTPTPKPAPAKPAPAPTTPATDDMEDSDHG